MLENCPLSGGGMDIERFSAFCRRHCEGLWDDAVRNARTFGHYDVYREPDEIDKDEACNHDGTPLQYSHDALQAVDESPLRIYSIVDECMECGIEFGEEAYQFECPYNGQQAKPRN